MVCQNDENVPPGLGPSDDDRARFGFSRRPLRLYQGDTNNIEAGKSEGVGKPGVALTSTASDAAVSAASSLVPVTLLHLLDSVLGDPDASLPLLRAKPAVPKYDFKGRIMELLNMNKALKSAIIEQREKHKALIDAIAPVQVDINLRLRTMAGELAMVRQQLHERSIITEELQQAVRAVWREESEQERNKGVGGIARQEMEVLQKCCVAESNRANAAEALLHERDLAMADMRHKLDEANAAERVHRKICTDRAKWAKKQVNEAAQLLQRQVEEATNDHQKLLLVAKQREGALTKQLARMTLHVQELETQCSKAGVAVNAFPRELDEAFTETIAEHSFLEIEQSKETLQDQMHDDTSERNHTAQLQDCARDSFFNEPGEDNEITQADSFASPLSDLGEHKTMNDGLM